MTLAQLEKRVESLEKSVAELQRKASISPAEQRHWWRDNAGAFANDPAFEEMARLVQEYRESLDPDLYKKKKRRQVKNHARS